MNTKTKTILQSLFSVILFFIFINVSNAQLNRAVNGEEAVCTIKADDKIYTVKPNQLGLFDEVSGMYPGEIVAVEVYYPNGVSGEKVIAGVEDGGSLDGGNAIRVITLDNKKKITFNFTVFDIGTHRISLRKENDVKTIQIWGEKKLTAYSPLFNAKYSNAPADSTSEGSGNNNDDGTEENPDSDTNPDDQNPQDDDCQECSCSSGDSGESVDRDKNDAGDPFVVYTGNESRNVKDLQIWGGVGQTQLEWMRFGNSRAGNFKKNFGDGGNWNHSFKYEMFDAGTNGKGQAKIAIHHPEGSQEVFTKSDNNSNLWQALPGVGARLYQNADTFILHTRNGYLYRFEKLADQSGNYYQLQSFLDNYQNKYNLLYDSFRRLIQIKEPAGRYLQINYGQINGEDIITSVNTSDGRSVTYHYTILDDSLTKWVLLDSVYYGDGTAARYTYSQRERGERPSLEHAIDPRYTAEAVNMKYTYDTITHITGFINQEKNGVTGETMVTLKPEFNKRTVCYANGKTEVFNLPFDQRGKVPVYTDGLGRITTNTFEQGDGFLHSKTDALGRTITYSKRTVYGAPLEIIHPDGSKEKWTRNSLDLVLTYTDELNRVTKYTRDNNNQRVTRIDYPDKTFETFTYNDFGQVLDKRLKNGGIEHSVYDSRGLKIRSTDAQGDTTHYTYDNADRLAAVIDAKGNTTAYAYNERGLLIMVTNPGGSKKTFQYDEFGNRTKITNELGHSWSTLYDEFKRPVTLTDPLNRVTKYQYDLAGGVCGCTHSSNKPTKIILPSGKSTEIEYDVEWQKIKETAGAGTPDAATTFYEYDLAGNLVSIVDPKEKEWKTEYDKRDRKTASTDPLGNRTGYEYDSVGNVVKVIRPDNSMTLNYYDKMNRDTMTIDPKGQVTMMAYDGEGNMIRLTDTKKQVYSFEYDLLNRKKKMIYPDGLYESYTYDSVGNLKTYTTRSGHVRTYIYDKRNRETNSSWKSPYLNDSTPSITRAYDAANRLLTLRSSVSLLTYKYNNSNELISETQYVSGTGAPKTIAYGSNKDGLRKFIIYPDGSQVNYNYTGRNQVATISTGGTSPLVTYIYDLNGNRLSKTLSNGTDVTYAYDDASKLLELLNSKASKPFASFTYGYDNMNRKTFVKRGNGNGDVYGYDSIDQVAKVLYEVASPDSVPGTPVRTVNYTYDSSGNRTSVIDNGKVTNYISNNLNQYTNIGDSSLSYTKDGNLKKLNGWTFTYDAQNRLTKAQKSDTAMSFAYDPMNRCVQRKLSKGLLNLSNTFLYYDDWNLIEERNTGDSQIARYIHGPVTDEILTKTSNNNSIYYHYDALGSVVRLTDSTGKMVERYVYDDVFGKASIRDSTGKRISVSAYDNRFLFTGREYLKEIKLYDYRNRMYSDSLGRFLQMDPIGFDASDYNLYRYVLNNDINLTDPFGLETWNPSPGHNNWYDPPFVPFRPKIPITPPTTPNRDSRIIIIIITDCNDNIIEIIIITL